MKLIKHNENPKGIKACDCVVRAIAYATGLTWEVSYQRLCEIGLKIKRMPNEKQTYEKLLEQMGWKKFKQPRDLYNNKFTVEDWCKLMNKANQRWSRQYSQKVIISVANHLTVVDDNYDYDSEKQLEYELVDTWNCSHKCVGNYWIKEDEIPV